jgi:predicted DNA-binding transcriptional regulator AlpA
MHPPAAVLLPAATVPLAARDPMAAEFRDPEAARYLGKSESWLRQARMRNEGPAWVKDGRSVRYRKIDLDRYLEQRLRGGDTVHPTPTPTPRVSPKRRVKPPLRGRVRRGLR